MLRVLERRHLVRRESSAHDRRARALTITAEGARLALAGVAAVHAVDRRVFASLRDPMAFAGELRGLLQEDDT